MKGAETVDLRRGSDRGNVNCQLVTWRYRLNSGMVVGG